MLFQYDPEHETMSNKSEYAVMSTTNLAKKSSDSEYSEAPTHQVKSAETFPAEVTNCDACSQKETNTSPISDNKQGSEKELCAKNFYEDAAEYIGRELISAALEGGSKDSITVMVMLFQGIEYH